jgi:hypothetical protein
MNEFANGNFRGVRNFAQQVLHVAGASYQLYGAVSLPESRSGRPLAHSPRNLNAARIGRLYPSTDLDVGATRRLARVKGGDQVSGQRRWPPS